MVSVGTDHHRFDRLVGWIDQWAAEHRSVKVIVQRGSVAETEHAESHALIPYGELCELFQTATAVISHGGPSTVMDSRAAGRLPIVFPRDPARGEHVDGHQLRFAHHLARHQQARVAFETNELAVLLDEALASPDNFVIPVSVEPAPGVVAFGQVVDDLIGAATPVRSISVPSSVSAPRLASVPTLRSDRVSIGSEDS